MTHDLTINEAAYIAEVPSRHIEKAIEMGVLKTVKRRAGFSTAAVRCLPLSAVGYLATTGHSSYLRELPVSRKKALWTAIKKAVDGDLETIELEPGLTLDLPRVAGPKIDAAQRYVEHRRQFITADPEIFGGVPILKGTRIPVYVIRGRLADGDTLADLVEDYPNLPAEAFTAADIYARTHPERGRPVVGSRPWGGRMQSVR